MTLSRSFAEWALGDVEIPDHVRQIARRHLLDATGNAIAAQRLRTVDYVVDEALAYAHPAVASIFGLKARVPPSLAALANGTLIHALDFDDTHGGALVHGSAVILPSVLAMTQAHGTTVEGAVDAFILGLEVTMRIGRTVRHGFHRQGFHATPIAGIYGAVIAAAKVANLDVETTVNALGLAGSQASGSLEFLQTGASTKQIHPGWAGLSAIMSVALARRGATGPDTTLEGKHGLFQSYVKTQITDVSDVISDLGNVWETTRMTIKPYPVCQLSHASLDATSKLRRQLDFKDVTEVSVHLPTEAIAIVGEPTDRKIHPRSGYEAKFSVQWNIAALLIDGSLRVDHFTVEHLSRTEIAELAGLVSIDAAEYDGPPADAPGRLAVVTRSGDLLVAEVEASRGSPDNPMTDQELIEKFVTNVGRTIKDPHQIASSILTGRLESVNELFALLEIRSAI